MSDNIKQRPFNLLYKFEPQKSNVDIIYDFVTGPGRYIVVTVMFVIILAFIYRFPLDKHLNDEINKANQNLKDIHTYSTYIPEFKTVFGRTEAAKKYLDIYPDEFKANTTTIGQPRFSTLFEMINAKKTELADSISIETYTYTTSPEGKVEINITGSATEFKKAEEFRDKLRSENDMFSDVLVSSLGASKGEEKPKYNIIITVRKSNIQ